MNAIDYAARIEAAKEDATELLKIAEELAALGGSDAGRLRLVALAHRFKLHRTTMVKAQVTPTWLTELGITVVDGRPLHRYNVSDRVYEELQRELRAAASSLNAHPSRTTAAKFVLWAAEWFRRCYDGTGQRWDALGGALNLRADWNTYRALTDLGLTFWGIAPLHINGTHHRLAAIARQGGFPVAAIEGPKAGWAPRFLEALVGMLLAEPVVSLEAADRIAERLMASVPTTWRSSEIRVVSAELAVEIVRLRQLAESEGVPSGALVSAWLDKNMPDWRYDLPIAVSSSAGRALVDGLMKAVVLKAGGGAVSARRLLLVESGQRREKVELRLAGVISDSSGKAICQSLGDEWTRLRLFPAGEFARFVSGELATADPIEGGAWYARPSSARSSFDIPPEVPVACELRGGGQRVGREFILPGGNAVPGSVRVYVVVSSQEAAQPPGEYQLIGNGSGGYAPETIYVDIPSSWGCEAQGLESHATSGEEIPGAGRTLWEISGKAIATAPNGDTYLFRTGQKGAARDRLALVGEIATGFSSAEGVPIFCGAPRLHVCEGRHERVPAPNEAYWRKRGAGPWRLRPDTAEVGSVQFAWRDPTTGHIRDGQDAVVLPRNFVVKRTRQSDWLELTIEGWDGRVEVDGALRTANGFRLRVQGSARSSCELRLHGGDEPIALSLPIPHDAWIESWSRGPLERNALLSMATINQFVAKVDGRCELLADVLDRDRRPVAEAVSSWWVDGELPLSAISDELAALLRPLGDNRGSIKLNFNDARENHWYIGEFDHELVREGRGWLPNRAVVDEDARLVGRALQDPARERDFGAFGLEASLNHRPFELPTLHGAWLIYLRSNERVLSCPRLVNGIDLSAPPNSLLGRAMAIADAERRSEALNSMLDGLFAAPASPQSRAVLRSIIDLAVSLDGLPPSTFDVLTLIGRRDLLGPFMLFTAAESEIEPVLRIADGIPFDWSIVSQSAWDRAGEAQGEYLFSQLPEQLALIAQMIGDRRRLLAEHQPVLATFLGQKVEKVALRDAANMFLNRSEDRITATPSPFRPSHAAALGEWPVGLHFWRALDAPVAAALAAKGLLELNDPQIRCIKEISHRHPRWFREGYAATLQEKS